MVVDWLFILLLLLGLLDVVVIFACARWTDRKGRGPLLGVGIGWFFSIFGLVVIAFIPAKSDSDRRTVQDEPRTMESAALDHRSKALGVAGLSAAAGAIAFLAGVQRWDDPSSIGRFVGFFALIVGIEALGYAAWLLVKGWRDSELRAGNAPRTVLLTAANLVSIGALATAFAHFIAP